MSSNRSFKSSLELSTSASGSPLIARPDAVVGNSTQANIGHSQKHLLKKFAPPFERYQSNQTNFSKARFRSSTEKGMSFYRQVEKEDIPIILR